MGVSIFLRPGTIMRPTGEPVNITPGLRSQFATQVRWMFGNFPIEMFRDGHHESLMDMARAASVYTTDDDNVWLKLAMAVDANGVVTLFAEY